jgi:hypothetical protein
MAAVDAVLSPPVRVPAHSVGFLLTLKEQARCSRARAMHAAVLAS